MIYISSSCVKADSIKEAVETLVKAGFNRIELSGGTGYYEGLEEDLVELKQRYELDLICHNYFPPPKGEGFVLNLASLDPSISALSMNQVARGLNLSKKIGAKRYGVHAGYLIHISAKEIGKPISKTELSDRKLALKQFKSNYREILALAGEVEIYLENNPLSKVNLETYAPENPFFLTCYQDYLELKEQIDFNLLLDVGHLKVSCVNLDLDFPKELDKHLNVSDYIHLSDNDGSADTNMPIRRESELFKRLRSADLQGKILTLEVYGDLSGLKDTYDLIGELI